MNPEGIAATEKSSSANSVSPPSTAKSHMRAKKTLFLPHSLPSLGSFYTASFELHLVLRGITLKNSSI